MYTGTMIDILLKHLGTIASIVFWLFKFCRTKNLTDLYQRTSCALKRVECRIQISGLTCDIGPRGLLRGRGPTERLDLLSRSLAYTTWKFLERSTRHLGRLLLINSNLKLAWADKPGPYSTSVQENPYNFCSVQIISLGPNINRTANLSVLAHITKYL